MRFLTTRRLGPAVLGIVAAATAVAAAVPAAASASAQASPVVGHVYVNDNTAGTNTIGAFDRHADGTLTAEAGSPFAAGGAGTGAGLASQGALQISPDGRFLIAADAGSNRDLGAADQGERLTQARARRRRLLRRRAAGQRRDPRRPGIRGQLRYRRQQLHRLPAAAQRPPAAGRRLGGRAARRLAARRRAVQRRRHQARRDPRRDVPDRQLHRRLRRAPDPGAGITLPRAGPRPVRQPVPPHQPGSAVRIQRPQHRHRHRVGVRRLRRRDADVDRILPVRRPADRPVLGGDQP